MTKSNLFIIFNTFAITLAISGCRYEKSQKDTSQEEPGTASFALDESSSPSPLPSTLTSPNCPSDMPNILWMSIASGSSSGPNCVGGLSPDYAVWSAEDVYNQNKASIIQSCATAGGSAVVGNRVWLPAQNQCQTVQGGFAHRTIASVTCCATPSTSPSPSPEEATYCEVAFGPNYSQKASGSVVGVGQNAGCTAAKAESLADYDAKLDATKAQCLGKSLVYGVIASSRCDQVAGVNKHQRGAFYKCCVDWRSLASMSPTPTSFPTASLTPSPMPSTTLTMTPTPTPSPSTTSSPAY